MKKVKNLPFKAIFDIYGSDLPSRAVFFTHKSQHGLTYVDLKKFYKRNTIYGAWKEFVRDFALYAETFAKKATEAAAAKAAKAKVKKDEE